MSVFPKFIIETHDPEGDCLIIANCTYHKQLALDVSKVKGGGWWSLDREKLIFTLHGDSSDFGRAKIQDIANCVQRKMVFSSYALHRNLSNKHTFQYRDQVGDIICLETYNESNDNEVIRCEKCNVPMRHNVTKWICINQLCSGSVKESINKVSH